MSFMETRNKVSAAIDVQSAVGWSDNKASSKDSEINKVRKIIDYNRRIVINTRGTRHDICLDKLDKIPNSRLGVLRRIILKEPSQECVETLCDSYSPDLTEFYYDRDPFLVNMVLNIYSHSDKAHLSYLPGVCPLALVDELAYWRIDYSQHLDECCVICLDDKRDQAEDRLQKQRDIIAKFNRRDDFGKFMPRLREKLWLYLEWPSKSWPGRIIYSITLFLIIASTLNIILFSIPSVKIWAFSRLPPTIKTVQVFNSTTNETYTKTVVVGTDAKIMQIVNIICSAWFPLELAMRIFAAPNKRTFFTDPLNLLETLSVLPLIFAAVSFVVSDLVTVTNIISIFRILLLLKLLKHSASLRALVVVLQRSRRYLFVLVLYLSFGVILFSSLVYMCELESDDNNFYSIPAAFWWALITMSTVGYGDMVPRSILGRCVGACCALSGILLLAMPVGLLSTNFIQYYRDMEFEKDMRKRFEKCNRVEKASEEQIKLESEL